MTRIRRSFLASAVLAFAAGIAACTATVSRVYAVVCDTARTFGRWMFDKLVVNPAREAHQANALPERRIEAAKAMLACQDQRDTPKVFSRWRMCPST